MVGVYLMALVLAITNENNDSILNVLKEIDDQKEEEIKGANEKIQSFQSEVDFMHPLIGDYEEYITCIENGENDSKILRKVTSYLSSYKGFIDQWETYVKRNKDEEFVTSFKKALNEVYDRCFEYRFIYNLRNYAQHNGKPVSKISRSINTGIKIGMDKNSFIAAHSGMQSKFRKELENLDENLIDVDNAIRVVHEELIALHSRLINESLKRLGEEALSAAVTILKFYKEHDIDEGELALSESTTLGAIRKLQNDPANVTVNLHRIPKDLAKQMVKGSHIKFKFKGKHAGKSPSFPYLDSGKFALAMPQFYSGGKYVERLGLPWVQIGEQTGWAYKDGYDRYFAVYMPMGLSIKEYSAEYEKYKDEAEQVFKATRKK